MDGSSQDVCAQTYGGPAAFSEPEVKSLSDFILANAEYIGVYLSLHSYSQVVLYPYGYTTEPTPDNDALHELCESTAAAMTAVHGTVYTSYPMSDLGNLMSQTPPLIGFNIVIHFQLLVFVVVPASIGHMLQLASQSRSHLKCGIQANSVF